MTGLPPPNPYQQQPYYPPPGYPYPPVRGTNTMAILALVFAFVFAPAAIVLGHLARKQIRQTGEEGDGLALAGMIIGYIFTGLAVVGCLGYVIFIIAFAAMFATTSSTSYLILAAG
jgi:uncharacterized protein DUF4190